jgi:N6-adenosine-specific RNA methylase IME4
MDPDVPAHDDEIAEVETASIIVQRRLRPIRDSVVNELVASIKELGLIYPITIRADWSGGRPILVAGAHRLAATIKLGWKSIPCLIVDAQDDDTFTLIEIDENLTRGDLSQAERAIHIAKRKEVYERLHPQTKHGTPGVSRQIGDIRKRTESDRFTEDTVAKTGRSERDIQRDASRFKHIPQIAEVIGTSLDKGEELDALAKLAPVVQAPIIARAKAGGKVTAKPAAKKARRAEREKELAAATQMASEELGSKLYNVIYSDPPWSFEPYSRETGLDRAADNHFPTMSTDEICALEIPAADDCVLFLWATAPMLPEALAIMAAWGFAYKSHCIWQKDRLGTGYWFRNRHELLLVGTRGNIPAPAPGTQFASVIEAAVGAHSAKPALFAEMIEQMFPNAALLEMFARGAPRAGWTGWGNEAARAA